MFEGSETTSRSSPLSSIARRVFAIRAAYSSREKASSTGAGVPVSLPVEEVLFQGPRISEGVVPSFHDHIACATTRDSDVRRR